MAMELLAPGAQLICADITDHDIGAQACQRVRITKTQLHGQRPLQLQSFL